MQNPNINYQNFVHMFVHCHVKIMVIMENGVK